MENKDKMHTHEVFNGVLWQAQMVKNLLENEGIEAFLQDENVGSLHLPWESPGGIGLVRVVVAESDFEKAIKIVGDYEATQEEKPE